jgi:hypothetical protein
VIIALDYDKTYTADPSLWNIFIDTARVHGHEIICITMRYPHEKITAFDDIEIYYTCRYAKLQWAKKNNIHVDIWIDDKPEWLFDNAASAA